MHDADFNNTTEKHTIHQDPRSLPKPIGVPNSGIPSAKQTLTLVRMYTHRYAMLFHATHTRLPASSHAHTSWTP